MLFETPWTEFVVFIPRLLDRVGIPELTTEEAIDILRMMSDLIHHAKCDTSEEILSRFEFPKGKQGSNHRKFIKAVSALSDSDREACCFHGHHPKYELRDGTPLPEILETGGAKATAFELLRAAFLKLEISQAWAFPPNEWSREVSNFPGCFALKFNLKESNGELRGVTPLLYTGHLAPVDALEIWESQLYIETVSREYPRMASAIQAEWLRAVPGASSPDPVFSFIQEPTASKAASAMLFLSSAYDRLTAQEAGDQPSVTPKLKNKDHKQKETIETQSSSKVPPEYLDSDGERLTAERMAFLLDVTRTQFNRWVAGTSGCPYLTEGMRLAGHKIQGVRPKLFLKSTLDSLLARKRRADRKSKR